jgi:hypothetical protein
MNCCLKRKMITQHLFKKRMISHDMYASTVQTFLGFKELSKQGIIQLTTTLMIADQFLLHWNHR